MKRYACLFLYISLARCGVIIPEELPSLLSVAYSNIPPIKKGTDSRVGFGFAFGNHADFQVVFELGPQTNTNPIGQTFPSNTKRQVPTPDIINKNREKFLSDPGKFLSQWAQNMKRPQHYVSPEDIVTRPDSEIPNLEDSVVELVKNKKGHYEIHQPSPALIPKKSLNQLKKLYGEKSSIVSDKKEYAKTERTPEQVKIITEDLSNVDLD